MSKKLTDQNILITGASTGMGRAIAIACAQEGANVALIARSVDKLETLAVECQDAGVKAVVCAADLGDEAQVVAAFEQARTELGVIDVLVNNGGTNVAQRSIEDTSMEQWRMLLEVNLTSAYVLTKLALPDMLAQQSGTVVNVSSKAAVFPSILAGVGYSTTKLGMDALTQVTNEEANPHNVRACIICPGVANTPILDRRPAPPPMEERLKMIQPEDIADAVLAVITMPQRTNIRRLEVFPTSPSVA